MLPPPLRNEGLRPREDEELAQAAEQHSFASGLVTPQPVVSRSNHTGVENWPFQPVSRPHWDFLYTIAEKWGKLEIQGVGLSPGSACHLLCDVGK